MKMMKNENDDDENEQNKSDNIVNMSKTFASIGESWKGQNWGTQTPPGVQNWKRSAAMRARNGQSFTRIRQRKMLFSEVKDGQTESFKGKRKLNLQLENNEIDETFSPKKLPKISHNTFLNFSRLGSGPGRGTQHQKMLDKGDSLDK